MSEIEHTEACKKIHHVNPYRSVGNLTDDELLEIIDCPHYSHDAFIMIQFGAAYVDRNYVAGN